MPTDLEAMKKNTNGKTMYYDPRIAWSFNDFVRPGIGGTALDPLRKASNGLMNTLLFAKTQLSTR